MKPTFIKISLSAILCFSMILSHAALIPSIAFAGRSPAESSFASYSVSEAWTMPENISKSGAASDPFIAAGKNGKLQVFWLDRIDGLVSSSLSGDTWSAPQKTAIPDGPSGMPYLITDRDGIVHAFWKVTRANTGAEPGTVDNLYHSQIKVGATEWSTPEALAEDALIYSVTAPVNGGLSLAYIRQANTETGAAGVYVSQLLPGRDAWQPSEAIFTSVYYRLLSQGDTEIAIGDDSAGQRFVIWKDPFQNQWLYSTYQTTESSSLPVWSGPAIFGDNRNQPSDIRLMAMPGSTLSIWQTTELNHCALYQQNWQENTIIATPIVTSTKVATAVFSGTEKTAIPENPSANSGPGGWGSAEQIFPNLGTCPAGDHFWPDPQSQRAYWIWGEGTSSLSLSAWNIAEQKWSAPLNESFSFEDTTSSANTGRGMIVLSDLSSDFSDGHLAVAGTADGEIWFTRSKETVTDFAYAPPPLWSAAQPVTNPDQSANDISLVMDQLGIVHLVFAQPVNKGPLGASLIYTQWAANAIGDSGLAPNQVTLFQGNSNEIIRQPQLAVDETSKLLNLVWSGGDRSDIFFSRVSLDKADIANEWFPAQPLTNDGMAANPQIGVTTKGELIVIYSIPVNEHRGIFMTKSVDRGQNWTTPVQIFNAASAGLQSIDHLSMAITPDDTIHAAWTETSPAGNGLPRGIYYMASSDGGSTWEKPAVLVGLGNDWPKLINAGDQLHLIYAQLSQNGGLLWHRSLPVKTDLSNESAWSPALRIPGWDEVSLPYGVSASGALSTGQLYVVGLNPSNGSFYYSVFKNGDWGKIETFAPLDFNGVGVGLQAATRPEGGDLAVAWMIHSVQANSATQLSSLISPPSSLYFSVRRIETIDIPVVPTSVPTPTPTIGITPTPTVIIPTATPDLNRIPAPNDSEQLPLIIGGMFAALIVVGFLTINVISRRRK